MNEPLVSIITPVYNAGDYLAITVRSVLDQTYHNWELWLIDDASSDNSKSVITKLSEEDSRIQHLFLESNSGPAVARNTGIKKAKGTYIAFLDADDIWKPEKLQKQVKFMQDGKYALSFSHYDVIDKDGHSMNRMIKCPKSVTYRALLKENVIGCLTGMYNRELTGDVLMPEIYKRQDYGFWLNLLKRGITGYGIQESLAYYRKYSASLSGNKLTALKYNWLLLRDHQQFNFFQSAWYFSVFLLNKTLKYFGL